MSIRYTPLPNPQSNPHAHNIDSEMQAAFDYSDDEEEDDQNNSESRPLNPTNTSLSPPIPQTSLPGAYDFENVDYDYPPPGSPPHPSAVALPNEYGNSNGYIPSFDTTTRPIPQQSWIRRTTSRVLPSTFVQRFGLRVQRPTGAIGGGAHNDGVFANVTAKPSVPVRVQEGDETYIVPEDSRNEAPPSYAAAQADAVPPYWETTVHAPFSPDAVGEMIIDSLPTGSLFSFLWNMLVSISFQFVGFLLTYLLHTTHAARLGSRAGLGVTLIQYGFAFRSRMDVTEGDANSWGDWKLQPTPTGAPDGTSASRDISSTNTVDAQNASMFADATAEWLSFFLMTIGWFILLTSILGFWRVKRWERGILASQRETSTSNAGGQVNLAVVSQLERAFGLRGISRPELFRQGFGFGLSTPRDYPNFTGSDNAALRAEEGLGHHVEAQETDPMIPGAGGNTGANSPERERPDRQVMGG
ncbi:hypothetical protein AMATHDRAFT_1881 [Amanita thiersii Skay4041]|uniref:Metal homeostatis protein bsd2 n=1 Tax=Amanita thiersii Skay4041 TaxID=703135 RepID=A0A2A9NQL5_9AGAR|nr:hypothetical protein AMATHDRAFT_1881 [Amanita thiersii Skay4041]